jgi:hypothetical protein
MSIEQGLFRESLLLRMLHPLMLWVRLQPDVMATAILSTVSIPSG